MCNYKIVLLKDHLFDMVKVYPLLASQLYYQQNDSYETKQVEHMFQAIDVNKEKLLNLISKREDYSYYHNIHKLINPLTDEVISIKMNEYDIEVKESHENHIIFDMIKGFSKNFYMIKP